MKGLIIYKSSTGSSECYAKWLAEETGFTAVSVDKVKNLEAFDILIIGSYIKMGSISISGWVKKNWSKIKDKKLFFYTTSAMINTDPELQKRFEACFSKEIRAALTYFPLNGKFNLSELKWLDRKIMNFAIKMTAKADPDKAKEMAQEFSRINRDDIKPIVQAIRQLVS